ncbi:hypothetical protein P4O66_000154 [Electrophorus voltai]|uniref:Reverse transcriptase domain-containing protein n=1 Tax=Electrophorus voltai TaxID=2609070 RepID=A0AAD8ZW62_9TELE|nr:hypothetical protein P4O66_000154 [Electrophorus voltai]
MITLAVAKITHIASLHDDITGNALDVEKLGDLGLHTSLCDWISNFLTDRPQSVRVGNCASSTLIRDFITSSLPASTDPLQFAYRHNCSTDDAIAHLLHTTLTHLDEGRGNYVKMLFVDYSSAFNTIIPSLLTTKLGDLGLHTSLCDWISNFLTDRPQSVRVGNCASSTLTLSTGAPQGCVLSPLLYSLYTYDCTATSSSNIIVKFADDTVVVGLISDNDERGYLEEIKHLENWCQENNLLLNISKTKELIVDCSKKQERHYQPVRISGTTVERVDSFRYLGVHISQDLSWSRHTSSLAGLQTALQGTAELLHLHYREHPHGEHHSLVWE